MFPELKLFRDIATARSVSRGAIQNGISQSAASQHLQEIEKRLGATLLDRSKRPLTVTEAGRMYLEFCRDVVRRVEDLDVALDPFRQDSAGQLRVGCIYSIALTEMGRLRDQFSLLCPTGELKVEYLRPDKVYDAVNNESVDLGLVSYPEPSRTITVIPWRDEKMAVAVSPRHPFAKLPSVRPQDLDGEEYIAFDPDLTIRRELDRFFREAGVNVRIAMHFDNIQMVKEAVALGQGISILPDRTMQNEIEQRRLQCIPLDAPRLVRPVGVVHRKRKKFNRAAHAFLRALPVSVPF